MKRILLLGLLLITAFANAQEKFNYTQEGLQPNYLVVEIPNKTQNELYTSTINWIKETYKNPDEVIKSTIENNKIKLEGVRSSVLCTKVLGSTSCDDAKYIIDIEFKEGKLRFLPTELKGYQKPSNTAYYKNAGGWFPIDLTDGKFYYNKKGDLKDITKLQVPMFYGIFNDLVNDLKIYIEQGKDNTSNSDW